jgi:Zn-dependent M16 (insulinase) family peptidase
VNIPGYEHLGSHELPEYQATGEWFRHTGSGAEVYHVVTDDPENLFAFAFKTVPPDSTGVAHILEHAVLCGSERYPVKDPFIQLVKGSLNTFLNAMTYPDKTVYPGASTVEKDLFNMMEVYGDAVFHPLLRAEFFRQEGHRLELGDGDSLDISGIVYNEMKGAYSSHDSIAARWVHRALLSDTPYGYDSGGDPAAIPDLTYEQFVDFHRRFYHPSNARIFLYGDIPTERSLEFLHKRFLSKFEPLEIDATIARQPRWSEPRELTVTAPSEGEDGTTSITTGWLLGAATDPEDLLAHELLSYILMGTNAGPLRKALIESGLGEDLSAPSGIETDLSEMIFAVGLRGTAEDKKPEVERLILDSLAAISRDGIEPDVVEAALRRVEFRNREIKGGGPNGLRLMGKSLRGWLHGESPDHTLRFEVPFTAIREKARPGARFFESLIDRSLLSNSHRITITVRPDAEHQAREQAAVDERLAGIRESLTESDLDRLRAEQAELETMQATADSEDDLAKIPFLSVNDLPESLPQIPTEESETAAGVPLYLHDVFANGILYLDLAFDVSGVDPELLAAVPHYADAIGELGLPGRSYDEVATQISMVAGSFSSATEVAVPLHEVRRPDRRIIFRIWSLESTFPEAVDLMRELLLESRFADSDRLSDLIREIKSGLSGSVIPSGHQYAGLRAARALSVASCYEEEWRGTNQLLFTNALAAADAAAAGEVLARIGEAVIRRGNLAVNLTGDHAAMQAALPHVDRLVNGLPEGGVSSHTDAPFPEEFPVAESLVVPANVGYVAAAIRSSRLGTPEYVHEQVLAHLLRTGYLWESIRMKGGAYGAFASARGMDAVFGFGSYRDPNIVETLNAYRDSLDRAAEGTINQSELELAIIGVTGNFIRPLSPSEKSIIALRRSLYGITEDLRQENHETLLSTRRKDLERSAARLRESWKDARIAVLAGEEMLNRAADALPELAKNRLVVPL